MIRTKLVKLMPAAIQNSPCCRRDDGAHVLQLLHRLGRRADRAQREHERVGVDLVDRRRVQLAVDAEADADAGDEERRHAAERGVQHAEREERRELRAAPASVGWA